MTTDTTTTNVRPPAQRPADGLEPATRGDATGYAWQCGACPTRTPDHVTARVHSLLPGHVLDWLPVPPVASDPCAL